MEKSEKLQGSQSNSFAVMEMLRSNKTFKTNNKNHIPRVQCGFQVYCLKVMHPVSSESQSLAVPAAMNS